MRYLMLCWLMISLLGFNLMGQPETSQSTPSPTPQPPHAELITLKGSVRKVGGAPKEMESGWAFPIKPGEKVIMTIERSEKSPSEIEVSTPQGTDMAKVYLAKRGHTIRWETSAGAVVKFLENGILWKAPDTPGSCKISALLMDESAFSRIKPDEKILAEDNVLGTFVFHNLVMYPFDREGAGVIGGYPIGIYSNEQDEKVREPVASNRKAYQPPEYFIKIHPENVNVHLSEHFTLGDFCTETNGDKVRFIALDPKLVSRLESLIDGLQEKGAKVTDLNIIRGFVTPNQAERLRQKDIDIAEFSRSLYGDSVIFIIDEDADGIMDDLNGDGKVDIQDLVLIEEVVEVIEDKTHLYGGLGLYLNFKDPKHQDTPCVQIDTRGWRSRWGAEPEIEVEEKEKKEEAVEGESTTQ